MGGFNSGRARNHELNRQVITLRRQGLTHLEIAQRFGLTRQRIGQILCAPETSSRKPSLAVDAILQWADRYHDHHGQWPKINSGPIAESPGDTWRIIDVSLRTGHRGLPGGSSLCRLLRQRRGIAKRQDGQA